MSWPPATPPACTPSNSTGLRFALEAEMAAVYPAGPEPMITTFSTPRAGTGMGGGVGGWEGEAGLGDGDWGWDAAAVVVDDC